MKVVRRALPTALVLSLVGLHAPALPVEVEAQAGVRVVEEARLLEAMRRVTAYDLTATANGPRLQADVVLELVREAEAGDPRRRPLLIGHAEWYRAFLSRTGLSTGEAPIYVSRPYEVGQDLVVDFRRERVLVSVVRGPVPRSAANVRISWARDGGKPDSYSYDDTRSRPTLRVTQKRLITYRLVDFGDRLLYAEIDGLHGRPTSGPLGLLFDLIGEARVLESRSAFAADGVQVVRGRARKWGMERTETVTVWPDGHADQGVPPGRADLGALDRRLREPLELRFVPAAPPGES